MLFDVVNMHRLTPKIEEAMEFQIGLTVKQNLEKSHVWEKLWSIGFVCTFETNISDIMISF
jgi:hypothetical protein